MPGWEDVADAAQYPTTVWLSREKETDSWKPLRKVDCLALNEGRGRRSVLIEGGRATANPVQGVISYNYSNLKPRELMGSTWFTKEEKTAKNAENDTSKDRFVLVPLKPEDTDKVEILYQRAVAASSSLSGGGLDKIIKEEEVILSDDTRAVVVRTGGMKRGNIALRRKPKPSLLSLDSPKVLQRGYGPYNVEGEEEEATMMGDVKHVIFVVHGIGEALWSREDFTSMPSMAQEMNTFRLALQTKQVEAYRKELERAQREKVARVPNRPGRIEVITIEWYDRIHSDSSTLKRSLLSTTINSIHGLRRIANDVVFDVLMYMTPTFCAEVLDCVTNQINERYEAFVKVHPNFVKDGGKCSIIGHSLGSVIVWDLLSILKDNTFSSTPQSRPPWFSQFSMYQHTASSSATDLPATSLVPRKEGAPAAAVAEAAKVETATWGPCLPQRMTRTIPFAPDFTIFLGSPLGLFLTLRGAHSVFNEMRRSEEAWKEANATPSSKAPSSRQLLSTSSTSALLGKTFSPFLGGSANALASEPQSEPVVPSSPFTLPSGTVYNIFHPSDPVAYRIEPLLLPEDYAPSDLPPPLFLVAEGKSLRLHHKAQEIGRNFTDFFQKFDRMTETAAQAASEFADGAVAARGAGAASARDLVAATAVAAASGGVTNANAGTANVMAAAATAVLASGANSALASSRSSSPTRAPPKWKSSRQIPRGEYKFALAGASHTNTRVDYQLQTGAIDNEYFASISAHSSYFVNDDVVEFVLQAASER